MNTVGLQASSRALFFRSIHRNLSVSDRHVVRQTLWLSAITTVELLGGLVQIALSTRILGPEGFGVLAVIIAVTSLIYGVLSIPGGSTVTTFVTREIAEGRLEEASRILRFTLAVSFGLSVITYAAIAALALTTSGLLGIEQAYLDAMLLYGVVGILMATQTEALAVLRLSDQISLGLAVSVVSTLTRVALLLSVWLTEGGLFEVILAQVVWAGVRGGGLLAAMVVSTRQTGMTNLLRLPSIKVRSDVIQFQTATFGRMTLAAVAGSIDSIFVAQLTSIADVGIYRAARQITDAVGSPVRMIVNGVQPEYSRQWYAGQGAALRRTSLRFTLLAFAVSATAFGALALFRDPVIRLFLGEGFSGVASLLLILIPAAVFSSSMAVLGALPLAAGRAWPSLLSILVGLVVSIPFFMWLVPVYGAEGAAWARTTYSWVLALVLIPFSMAILRQSYRI